MIAGEQKRRGDASELLVTNGTRLTGDIAEMATADGQTEINRPVLTCCDRFDGVCLTDVLLGTAGL